MAKVLIVGSRFLASELSSSGHNVRILHTSYVYGNDDDLALLEACDCCVVETSLIGAGYLEAGWVAGRGKPVFMIPTFGDVLASFRALGVTPAPDLVELKSLLAALHTQEGQSK